MSTTTTGEARETSGATTGGLLRYVRGRAGDDGVEQVLRRAGLPYTAAELEDQSLWWSYDTRIRLFQAATDVLGDPATMFLVGAGGLRSGLAHSLVLLLRAMGSPRQVFAQLPRAVAKFSTTSTMHVLAVGETSATIRFRLHDGYQHSRLDCAFAQGLIGTVPTIFGLPAAGIVHDECQSDGHPACVYHLSWERRSRLPWRRRPAPAVDPELVALRGQLRTLQSVATELVTSDDLETVLRRIVASAAEAVLAPAYLLAVDAPDGGEPLVHSAGLPAEDVGRLAETLLAGHDLGPGTVAVEIGSARRSHGRLAVLYRGGGGAMGDEASMLAAYAGHAAAALDLIIALEGARLEAERAGALLTLAHELAVTADVASVAQVVADALPRIVGCRTAGIMLWDPEAGRLVRQATDRLRDGGHATLPELVLAPHESPELAVMLADRQPLMFGRRGSSPELLRVMTALELSDVAAAPLMAGTSFLGVATAGWRDGPVSPQLQEEALARLRGVADQASTALQKARLLETVRHQASHDGLTGLPNRTLFLERLESELAVAGPDSPLAVLFCDLDRFKQVNDTLGHAAGDELLRTVAARLTGAVRPGDTVARLSGDEFAIVLPGMTEPGAMAGLLDRVRGCFRRPFLVEGHQLTVGASVGVAEYGGAGNGFPDALLREADTAMYRHKQGRSRESALAR